MGTEKIIDSKILIHYSEGTGRVTSVQDKWNGELPTSSFADVSLINLSSPWWWLGRLEELAFWAWSFTWDTRVWQVRGAGYPRRLREACLRQCRRMRC